MDFKRRWKKKERKEEKKEEKMEEKKGETNQIAEHSPEGFERGLELKRIVGTTKSSDVKMYFVRWHGCSTIDLVPAARVEKEYPEITARQVELRISSWNFHSNCLCLVENMEKLIPSEHRTERFVFKSKFESEYTILDFLGKGAFGTVYKCVSKKSPNEEVAVKLMEIFNKYPEQEATILKKLKHENILEIISEWTEHPPKKYKYPSNSPLDELTNDVYFIETEYCDLKSLHFWFNQQVPITHLCAKIILYEISKGLQYLHETKIVHRDLKPENILLTSDKHKSCVIVKIADFGISRVVTRATMTKEIGTQFYKCPEVSMNDVRYQHKVDIYALGVIFCEMLVLGDCSNNDEFQNRFDALLEDKIKENGFSISESCKEYLKDKTVEQNLIEEMVKLPGADRPEASDIIAKLVEMTPNISDEKIDIPVIREAENRHEFRLYGKKTSEKFIELPAWKRGDMLHTLDLNFVSVDAVDLTSCLKECVNLRSIEMSVFNEGDGFFPKISLRKLRKFFYRQLNGPENHYDYLTETRVESLLFFGPLEQLWENQMTVKIIITKLSVIEVQHEEDKKCKIYLTAVEGTKRLYDNLKNVENLTHIYFLDAYGNSEVRLDLSKFPEQTLETLVVDLPQWKIRPNVNEEISKFEHLKELFLSAYSQKDMLMYAQLYLSTKVCTPFEDRIEIRPKLYLNLLPQSIRVLSLSELVLDIKLGSGQRHLELDSLSINNCTFHDNFPFERMDSRDFKVKNVSFFVNISPPGILNIYEPTWALLNFLVENETWESLYFGPFRWTQAGQSDDGLIQTLEEMGVPANSPFFYLNRNGGKAVDISEHTKLTRKHTYRNFFMMPEQDEFQASEHVGIMSASFSTSKIPLFESHRNLDPAFVIDGTSGQNDYKTFTSLEGKATLKRILLKRVEIAKPKVFPFLLKGCKELVSLSLQNVKVPENFGGMVDLPNIKEFLYVLDEHLLHTLEYSITDFFTKERMKSSLFFNKKSFKDLWDKSINVLIAVDNVRVLELNHEKQLIWLQNCNYAYDIISESGMLEESPQDIKTFIVHCCLGLREFKRIPSKTLMYLSLTKVDINFNSLLDSGSFPCLQYLFLESNHKSNSLDLSKIPSTVRQVGLTSITVRISHLFDTCDILTLNECILPRDFASEFLPFLRVRKIGLLGPIFFAKYGEILDELYDNPEICQVIYVNRGAHFIPDRAKKMSSLLTSLGLGKSDGFEVSRKTGQWSLTIFDVQNFPYDTLTGYEPINSQKHPAASPSSI
ncbi:Mitogen-activated protein kinase 13 [Pseudolycoriella hygida]|uniref:non-specific serine/threonine protein kinase n=1 Tax=Pseudolycoriella hygida TaxID=35572 RepID=A0A9Q0S9M7_9DIPT|nr:Mitogen-activated protein kinase 13 [Pseudolycoriella hygida]